MEDATHIIRGEVGTSKIWFNISGLKASNAGTSRRGNSQNGRNEQQGTEKCGVEEHSDVRAETVETMGNIPQAFIHSASPRVHIRDKCTEAHGYKSCGF